MSILLRELKEMADAYLITHQWDERDAETCARAAGEIEYLRAENEVLKKQVEQGKRDAVPEWISVEDRVPEIGRTPILVSVSWTKYCEHEDGSPTEVSGVDVTEGEYVPAHGECGNYFDSYQGQHGDWQRITHWMPLPAAPKQEK